MYYNSAEVDEDLHCSFCKEKFTDVIKILPSCGESICGECYDDVQGDLDDNREFACQACKGTHVMPSDGLTDNRGLCRLIKKRKIEKPISDQAKELKEELAKLKDNFAAFKESDPRDHVKCYCDDLESQVVEAFESAITQLKKLQKETLKQIEEYRGELLESWLAANFNETQSSGEVSLLGGSQEKIALVDHKMAELTNKWDEYFSNPDTLATETEIHQALDEANRLAKTLESLRSSLKSQMFGGKLMTFKPITSFFEDENHLKEIYNFKLQYESTKIFQVQTPATRTLPTHSDTVYHVIPVSAGRLASCSRDRTIILWKTANEKEQVVLRGHASWVTCLAVLLNGWLASGSSDTTIKLWDLNEMKEIRTLNGHTKGVNSLAVLKNGHLVSYAIDDTIKVWSPSRTSGNLLMTMSGHGNRNWILPFGILSYDYLVTCTGDEDPKKEKECIMKVWNPHNGQMVEAVPTGHANILTIFALSDDQVALGFQKGTIKLIDWTGQAKSRTKEKAHTSSVSAFAQLSNGCLLSAGYDATFDGSSIKMWDLARFALLQTIETQHSAPIPSLCISQDETSLASASRDSTIKLWSIVSTIA